MANLKSFLFPYHWIDEIFINDEGQYDEEYGKEVIMYLLQALKSRNEGKEIRWPKDRYLKAIVRGYLQQEETMQERVVAFTNNKKGTLTDEELDDVIYKLHSDKKTAKQIVDILNKDYGCDYQDASFIYKREGWKRKITEN